VIRIVELQPHHTARIRQAAALLVVGFKEHWPDSWPDMESALEEVHEAVGDDRICRVAVGSGGKILGWIGGISEYDGHAWELHPLVVDPAYQGQGIGRALVADLEEQVRQRGGLTIYLGTDDEDGMTSLAGRDLYPNPLDHLARIENRRGHPFEFYQKVGYAVVGVIPDANGWGKPDILMAKRVLPAPGNRE
jgi:aminoglycoside 6'-N-acetyltransferase I